MVKLLNLLGDTCPSHEAILLIILLELLSILMGLLGTVVLRFVACRESRLVARGWSTQTSIGVNAFKDTRGCRV